MKILLPFLLASFFASMVFSDDGSVRVKAFDLPLSEFITQETHDANKKRDASRSEFFEKFSLCGERPAIEEPGFRAFWDCAGGNFKTLSWYKNLRNQYKVKIASKSIAGVQASVFTPKEGVSDANKNRIKFILKFCNR